MDPLLQVDRIIKFYGKTKAVNGISFHVQKGEIYGLIGPNGSGKTTTMNLITNLITPTDGDIRIKGLSRDDLLARKSLGYIPDELLLPETLTGKEYLTFVMKMYEVEAYDFMWDLARLFRIDKVLDQLIGSYSHGMKKKIQFMAALMHKPELIILDEPFRGLDPETVIMLKDMILQLKETRGLLIATHDLLMATALCSKVGILSNGVIVAEGTVDQLLRSYRAVTLEDVFLQATGLGRGGTQFEKVMANF
jgi:ABC-2 type transport system ATP-binding protein